MARCRAYLSFRSSGRSALHGRFRGNVAAPFLRRLGGADAPRRRGRGPGRRAQDPHDPAIDPAGAQGARPQLPIPRLHRPSLRRPSRSALGRWRRDEPRQPGAALPPSSSRRPRGRVRSDPPRRRGHDLPPSGWHGARRSPTTAGLHSQIGETSGSWTTSRCGTARPSNSPTLLTCYTHRPRPWQAVERVSHRRSWFARTPFTRRRTGSERFSAYRPEGTRG